MEPGTDADRDSMNDGNGYAVFLFPQALEALGDAIKPYLQESPAGAHVLCTEIDAGGSLIEMRLPGSTADGKPVEVKLMVPGGMVRMVVSAHGDEIMGFAPRAFARAASPAPSPGGAAGETAAASATSVGTAAADAGTKPA